MFFEDSQGSSRSISELPRTVEPLRAPTLRPEAQKRHQSCPRALHGRGSSRHSRHCLASSGKRIPSSLGRDHTGTYPGSFRRIKHRTAHKSWAHEGPSHIPEVRSQRIQQVPHGIYNKGAVLCLGLRRDDICLLPLFRQTRNFNPPCGDAILSITTGCKERSRASGAFLNGVSKVYIKTRTNPFTTDIKNCPVDSPKRPRFRLSLSGSILEVSRLLIA